MKAHEAFQKISKYDASVITDIVKRAAGMSEKHGEQLDSLSLHMDMCCAHATCPLKLGELLAARDGDFAHDVYGIRRHINRTTGELGDAFLPRFALPEGVTVEDDG